MGSNPQKSQIPLGEVADVLRSTRKKLGLTQIDLAKVMGISQSALSKMENAKLEPSARQWLEFCRATGIRADVLLSKGN